MRLVLAGIGAIQCVLYAQPLAQPGLRFEVASVRLNRTADCRGRWDLRVSHGMVIAENAPLRRIISRAYLLTDDRVSGPAWIDTQCYDIRAKAAGDASNRDLMSMLQALLAERLHLVAQREPRERLVFALVIDKGGSKLRPFGTRASAPESAGNRTVLFLARHMPDLCERLGVVTGRPVIDHTGLDGDYQIELAYLPVTSADSDASDSAFDVFSAVRNQLGLRLESRREIVDILKVHTVEKVPAEN